MKEIFNNANFWPAFIITTSIAALSAGITFDTYLDNIRLKSRLDSGLQECKVSFPGEKSKILWQTKCTEEQILNEVSPVSESIKEKE